MSYKAEREAKNRRKRRSRLVPEHVHGTWNGYTNYGCHCKRCKAAGSEYQRRYRSRRRRKQ